MPHIMPFQSPVGVLPTLMLSHYRRGQSLDIELVSRYPIGDILCMKRHSSYWSEPPDPVNWLIIWGTQFIAALC